MSVDGFSSSDTDAGAVKSSKRHKKLKKRKKEKKSRTTGSSSSGSESDSSSSSSSASSFGDDAPPPAQPPVQRNRRTSIRDLQLKGKSTKEAFLDLINRRLKPLGISVRDLNESWMDGMAISCLVGSYVPEFLSGPKAKGARDPVELIEASLEAGEEHLNVPAFLDAEDIADGVLDDMSMMTYLSNFFVKRKLPPVRKSLVALSEGSETEKEGSPSGEEEEETSTSEGAVSPETGVSNQEEKEGDEVSLSTSKTGGKSSTTATTDDDHDEGDDEGESSPETDSKSELSKDLLSSVNFSSEERAGEEGSAGAASTTEETSEFEGPAIRSELSSFTSLGGIDRSSNVLKDKIPSLGVIPTPEALAMLDPRRRPSSYPNGRDRDGSKSETTSSSNENESNTSSRTDGGREEKSEREEEKSSVCSSIDREAVVDMVKDRSSGATGVSQPTHSSVGIQTHGSSMEGSGSSSHVSDRSVFGAEDPVGRLSDGARAGQTSEERSSSSYQISGERYAQLEESGPQIKTSTGSGESLEIQDRGEPVITEINDGDRENERYSEIESSETSDNLTQSTPGSENSSESHVDDEDDEEGSDGSQSNEGSDASWETIDRTSSIHSGPDIDENYRDNDHHAPWYSGRSGSEVAQRDPSTENILLNMMRGGTAEATTSDGVYPGSFIESLEVVISGAVDVIYGDDGEGRQPGVEPSRSEGVNPSIRADTDYQVVSLGSDPESFHSERVDTGGSSYHPGKTDSGKSGTSRRGYDPVLDKTWSDFSDVCHYMLVGMPPPAAPLNQGESAEDEGVLSKDKARSLNSLLVSPPPRTISVIRSPSLDMKQLRALPVVSGKLRKRLKPRSLNRLSIGTNLSQMTESVEGCFISDQEEHDVEVLDVGPFWDERSGSTRGVEGGISVGSAADSKRHSTTTTTSSVPKIKRRINQRDTSTEKSRSASPPPKPGRSSSVPNSVYGLSSLLADVTRTFNLPASTELIARTPNKGGSRSRRKSTPLTSSSSSSASVSSASVAGQLEYDLFNPRLSDREATSGGLPSSLFQPVSLGTHNWLKNSINDLKDLRESVTDRDRDELETPMRVLFPSGTEIFRSDGGGGGESCGKRESTSTGDLVNGVLSPIMYDGTDFISQGDMTLLQRINSVIQSKNLHVSNFTTSWIDGQAMSALVDTKIPGFYHLHKSDNSFTVLAESLEVCHAHLGLEKLVSPYEILVPNTLDERADFKTFLELLLDTPNTQDVSNIKKIESKEVALTRKLYNTTRKLSRHEELVKQFHKVLQPYNVPVANFRGSWESGEALLCLVDSFVSGILTDGLKLSPEDRITFGLKAAMEYLNILPLVSAEEFRFSQHPNQTATYLIQFLGLYDSISAEPDPILRQKVLSGISDGTSTTHAYDFVNQSSGGSSHDASFTPHTPTLDKSGASGAGGSGGHDSGVGSGKPTPGNTENTPQEILAELRNSDVSRGLRSRDAVPRVTSLSFQGGEHGEKENKEEMGDTRVEEDRISRRRPRRKHPPPPLSPASRHAEGAPLTTESEPTTGSYEGTSMGDTLSEAYYSIPDRTIFLNRYLPHSCVNSILHILHHRFTEKVGLDDPLCFKVERFNVCSRPVMENGAVNLKMRISPETACHHEKLRIRHDLKRNSTIVSGNSHNSYQLIPKNKKVTYSPVVDSWGSTCSSMVSEVYEPPGAVGAATKTSQGWRNAARRLFGSLTRKKKKKKKKKKRGNGGSLLRNMGVQVAMPYPNPAQPIRSKEHKIVGRCFLYQSDQNETRRVTSYTLSNAPGDTAPRSSDTHNGINVSLESTGPLGGGGAMGGAMDGAIPTTKYPYRPSSPSPHPSGGFTAPTTCSTSFPIRTSEFRNMGASFSSYSSVDLRDVGVQTVSGTSRITPVTSPSSSNIPMVIYKSCVFNTYKCPQYGISPDHEDHPHQHVQHHVGRHSVTPPVPRYTTPVPRFPPRSKKLYSLVKDIHTTIRNRGSTADTTTTTNEMSTNEMMLGTLEVADVASLPQDLYQDDEMGASSVCYRGPSTEQSPSGMTSAILQKRTISSSDSNARGAVITSRTTPFRSTTGTMATHLITTETQTEEVMVGEDGGGVEDGHHHQLLHQHHVVKITLRPEESDNITSEQLSEILSHTFSSRYPPRSEDGPQRQHQRKPTKKKSRILDSPDTSLSSISSPSGESSVSGPEGRKGKRRRRRNASPADRRRNRAGGRGGKPRLTEPLIRLSVAPQSLKHVSSRRDGVSRDSRHVLTHVSRSPTPDNDLRALEEEDSNKVTERQHDESWSDKYYERSYTKHVDRKHVDRRYMKEEHVDTICRKCNRRKLRRRSTRMK